MKLRNQILLIWNTSCNVVTVAVVCITVICLTNLLIDSFTDSIFIAKSYSKNQQSVTIDSIPITYKLYTWFNYHSIVYFNFYKFEHNSIHICQITVHLNKIITSAVTLEYIIITMWIKNQDNSIERKCTYKILEWNTTITDISIRRWRRNVADRKLVSNTCWSCTNVSLTLDVDLDLISWSHKSFCNTGRRPGFDELITRTFL